MASTSVFSQSQYFDDSNVRSRSENPKVKAKAAFKAYIRYINKVHAFLTELSKRVQQLEYNHVIVMRRLPGFTYEADDRRVQVHPTLYVDLGNGTRDIMADQKPYYEEFAPKIAKDKNGLEFRTLFTVNGNVLKTLNSEFREMISNIVNVQNEMERLGKRKKTSTTNSFSMAYSLSEVAMNFFRQMSYEVPHVAIGQKQVRVRRPNPPRVEEVMVGLQGTGVQDVKGNLNFLAGDASNNAAYGLILSSALTSLFTIHSYNQGLSNTREWLISQGLVTSVDGRITTDPVRLQAMLKGNHASDLMRAYFDADMTRLTQETNGAFSVNSFAHAAFQTVLKTHRKKIESNFKWAADAGGDDHSHSKIAYMQNGTPEQHTFADWALTWPARKGANGQVTLDNFHRNVTLRLGATGQATVLGLIKAYEEATANMEQARAQGQTVEDLPALNRYIQKTIVGYGADDYAQFIAGWNAGAYSYQGETISALPKEHIHELSGEVVAALHQDSAVIKNACLHIRLYKKYQDEANSKNLEAAKAPYIQAAVAEEARLKSTQAELKVLKARTESEAGAIRAKLETLSKIANRSEVQERELQELTVRYNNLVSIYAQIEQQLPIVSSQLLIVSRRKARLQNAKTIADATYAVTTEQ